METNGPVSSFTNYFELSPPDPTGLRKSGRRGFHYQLTTGADALSVQVFAILRVN